MTTETLSSEVQATLAKIDLQANTAAAIALPYTEAGYAFVMTAGSRGQEGDKISALLNEGVIVYRPSTGTESEVVLKLRSGRELELDGGATYAYVNEYGPTGGVYKTLRQALGNCADLPEGLWGASDETLKNHVFVVAQTADYRTNLAARPPAENP